jgi:hypothetical protein
MRSTPPARPPPLADPGPGPHARGSRACGCGSSRRSTPRWAGR